MSVIQVARLRLRCDERERGATGFAIEDGLRTTVPDDGRLLVLRRVTIRGGLARGGPRQRQESIRDGWLAATADACHGGGDAAAQANCVWFANQEEAERLLLERLLAGRSPAAWYWRMAVPGWRTQPLRPWLAERISRALVSGDDRLLLLVARACVAAAACDELVEACRTLAGTGLAAAAEAASCDGMRGGPAERSAAADHRTREPIRHDGLVPGLPSGLVALVERLLSGAGETPAVAPAVVRAWLLRASPALALAPARLAALTVQVIAILERRPPEVTPTPLGTAAQDRAPPDNRANPVAPSPAPAIAPAASAGHDAAARRTNSAPSTTFHVEPALAACPELAEAPLPSEPRHSRHAGLWLVVPSLLRLGFREWLTTQPALLDSNPGARLMLAIARRHRVPDDDPALLGLAPELRREPPLEWVEVWRCGLDRWLRRTARRRLHDLVNRPGKLAWGDWSLLCEFPAFADLALRRAALDRDPGWTDWLGLSIRYRFAAREQLA